MIEKSFTEEEIHLAIVDMDGEKSPGPDSFTMNFLKSCWDVVKSDLMLVFNEFHERGNINMSMNSTFIALIPKKEGLLAPKDFRPISLINSVYKIILKVLSQRIRQVMGGITSSSQGAFVKDR